MISQVSATEGVFLLTSLDRNMFQAPSVLHFQLGECVLHVHPVVLVVLQFQKHKLFLSQDF